MSISTTLREAAKDLRCQMTPEDALLQRGDANEKVAQAIEVADHIKHARDILFDLQNNYGNSTAEAWGHKARTLLFDAAVSLDRVVEVLSQ